MWGKFLALNLGKKLLVVVTSLVAIASIGTGISGAPQKEQQKNTNATITPKVQQESEVKGLDIQKNKVIETEVISFQTTTVNDNTLAAGTKKTTVAGKDGVRTKVYEVTTENGIQTNKILLSDNVTTEPTNEVIAVGTYVAPRPVAAPVAKPEPAANTNNCDPNYSGGCVPIDSDVDCAGGSGNGPSYVRGPVTVVGSDIYGLDRDNDGLGCE